MKYGNYVNIRQGTASTPEFSNGNTLPITAMPFGMNHFAAMTRSKTRKQLFYHPDDVFCYGIRLTHMPSPWIGDYATFRMLATSGDEALLGEDAKCAVSKKRSTFRPWETRLCFDRFHTEMALIPTERGAALEMNWRDGSARRFCLTHADAYAKISISPDTCRVFGYTTSHERPVYEGFRMYYVMQFDTPFDFSKSKISHGELTLDNEGESLSLSLAFAGEGKTVTARLATSFISPEQAERNLETELGDRSVADIRLACERAWEERLSKIEIDADERTMETFYSCLYRAHLFPRKYYELDENGSPYHKNPATGAICREVFYTDNGFWDTYKTAYPLYSLILQDEYADMCRGFMEFYKQTGWLPRWLAPSAVNCMPGTSIDSILADAAVKGIVTDQKLLSSMLEATLKHATTPSDDPAYGRDGIADFNTLGYVSDAQTESVNKTEDYAYENFCIAQIALAVGRNELAEELLRSSLNYRNLFDPASGFLRGRDKNGNMRDDWTPFQWGAEYTEGSAWQNSLAMFHDLRGMARLMGGRERMLEHLDRLFASPPDYDVYGYKKEIHEMLEMASADLGQFAISNQPSFHIPYVYSCLGEPDRAAYWVRKAIAEEFDGSVSGLPGDEDNGSMGAWYVFSALGFYPVCPGTDQYVIASPVVRSAVIHTKQGELRITTDNQSEKNVYVREITLNGAPIRRTYLTQAELLSGALHYEMSDRAGSFKPTTDGLPYSLEG